MEMIKRATGIDILAVPFRGDAQINAALIAGEVEVAVVPLGDRGAADRRRRIPRARRSTAPSARRRCRTCRPSPRKRMPGFELRLAGLVRAGEDAARHRRRDPAGNRQGASPTPRCRRGSRRSAMSRSVRRPEAFDARFKQDLAKFAKS